jgi:hypothetical protein
MHKNYVSIRRAGLNSIWKDHFTHTSVYNTSGRLRHLSLIPGVCVCCRVYIGSAVGVSRGKELGTTSPINKLWAVLAEQIFKKMKTAGILRWTWMMVLMEKGGDVVLYERGQHWDVQGFHLLPSFFLSFSFRTTSFMIKSFSISIRSILTLPRRVQWPSFSYCYVFCQSLNVSVHFNGPSIIKKDDPLEKRNCNFIRVWRIRRSATISFKRRSPKK